ncbi:hypothetical protein JCM8547_003031 [Rhodosporidiobolus lusitaniae]
MAPLPDTHPDGDPFAAQDAQREANSLLGRLEARARLEDSASSSGAASPAPQPSLGFAPPRPAPSKPRASTGSNISLVPTPKQTPAAAGGKGKAAVVEDTSDDEEEEAVMTGDEGGSHGEDEGDEGSGSGTEAEGDGSEDGEGTPVGGEGQPQDEEEDDTEDDSEEDSDDESKGHEGGDVEMGDGARPKSPAKPSEGGDVAMADGYGATPTPGGEGGEEKPKKVRRRRAPRTPTPPPPAPRAPENTIRLTFNLPPRKVSGVPEFNVRDIAREKGLIPPEEVKKPEEEGDDEKEEEGKPGENGEPPKKKRKRGPNVVQGRFGGYDTADPFVDDSEYDLYEPRFYARPKREGYFICTGEVEVAPRRGRVKGSKNKPKLDENGNPVPAPPPARRKSGKVVVVGADGKPVHDSHARPSTPGASASASASGATPGAGIAAFGAPGGAPAVPTKPERKKGEFSAELQEDLDMLKRESDAEPWLVKNKFPPHLKDLLISVAYRALDTGEYGEDFFAAMPKIFPYNLFTMKKLIKREVFSKRIADMTAKQEEHLESLRGMIEESYPRQRREFEERWREWERGQAEGEGGVTAVGGVPMPRPRALTPEAGVAAFGDASPAIGNTPQIGAEGSPAPGKDDKDRAEPKWRFKFNDAMRYALFHACDIEDKKSELITEKQTLEKATTREVNPEKEHSAKNSRKLIYQRIVNMWPTDMMTSNQVSREISNYKIKLKRIGELPQDA